jgi:colanic acid biosynthesis protein WcaH
MEDEEFERVRRTLEARVPDPRVGLPQDVFLMLSRFVPLVNVDLLIRDDTDRALLTWRDDEFDGPGWHVPGGIIRYKETAEERVRATALTELGVDVEFDPTPVTVQQTIVQERAERGHFVSLGYRCRLRGVPRESLRFASGSPERGQWAWLDRCPPTLLAIQDCYREFLWQSPHPHPVFGSTKLS